MVKCTNGDIVILVTEGAYDSYFKDQGFIVIEENNAVENTPTLVAPDEEENEQNDGMTDYMNELKEKPISQWTKKEVRDFASFNNINISETKNVGQAKEIIRDFINSNE